jgi:hypothetical protein
MPLLPAGALGQIRETWMSIAASRSVDCRFMLNRAVNVTKQLHCTHKVRFQVSYR